MKFDEVLLNGFKLEKFKVSARQFLDGHALHNLTISTQWADKVVERLIVNLSTQVMSEELQNETQEVFFDIPLSWWQALKEKSKVLRRLFPVKYRRISKFVTFRRLAIMPKINRVFPNQGEIVLKEFINETEAK